MLVAVGPSLFATESLPILLPVQREEFISVTPRFLPSLAPSLAPSLEASLPSTLGGGGSSGS